MTFEVLPTEAPLVWAQLWETMQREWNYKEYQLVDVPEKPRWVETTEEMYDSSLGAVPPVVMTRGAFLTGEPWNHTTTGKAVYSAFRQSEGKYFAMYMTRAMFRETFGV